MKQAIKPDQFFEFLQSINYKLSDTQKSRFDKYYNLIRHWSGKQNLLSQKDLPFVYERHFLPSVFLCTMLKEKNERVLDIGSGAGFPGLVLKIIRPDLEISLIDSSRKKYLFLSEACDYLDLPCRVIHERMESYIEKTPDAYDKIISRAVTTLKTLWEWSVPVLKDTGQLLVLKGNNIAAEISDLENNDVYVDKILPSDSWVGFCDYIENKIIVKMERKNV